MYRNSVEWNLVGGLSEPSKMPCFGYSLPAAECKVGSKLRGIEDSVCHHCYAFRGNYLWDVVQQALYRRLASLTHPRWVSSMVTLIKDERFFRWHDSGDFQGVRHLEKVFDVCELTPQTRHWAPTREYEITKKLLKRRKLPKNLALRLSAHMIDRPGPIAIARELRLTISGVGTVKYTCPAGDQGNKCLDCRKCWDKRVFNVVYHKH